MSILRYLLFLPLLVVIGIYASEAIGVFQGGTEHYEILSGLGFSGGITAVLVWLSVVFEVAIVVAVLARPNATTFSILALWPWVPRIVTAFTGANVGEMHGMGAMDEMAMSLYATSLAMLAYAIYERGFYPKFLRKHSVPSMA